jgi:hypothetical protein
VLNDLLLVMFACFFYTFCGSSLGGWPPPVPSRVLEKYVVLVLGICKSQKRYGYTGSEFFDDVPASWEDPKRAKDVCETVLGIMTDFQKLGLQRDTAFLAPSAGVDQIMSVIAAMNDSPESAAGRVAFVVPIAGAYHPRIFEKAQQVLLQHGTFIFVHHHVEDSLCPWLPCSRFWNRLRTEMHQKSLGAVVINAMSLRDRGLMDKYYHNITHFLLSQVPFWDELLRDHPDRDGAGFVERCLHARLGEGHMTAGTGADYEHGYDLALSDASHHLQMSLVAHYAMLYASQKVDWNHPCSSWFSRMAAGARGCMRPESKAYQEIQDLRACFPEGAGGASWSDRVPCSLFAETLMGVIGGKQPGILQAPFPKDLYPDFKVVQRFGSLYLLHISFPAEKNNGKWCNLQWGSVIPSVRDRANLCAGLEIPRKCGKPENAQVNDTDCDVKVRAYLEDSSDWVPVREEDEIPPGVRRDDLLSLLVYSNGGAAVGHILGLVEFVKPFKRKHQKPDHSWVSDVFLWTSDSFSKVIEVVEENADERLRLGTIIAAHTSQGLKITTLWGQAARVNPVLSTLLRADAVRENLFDTGGEKYLIGARAQTDLRLCEAIAPGIPEALTGFATVVLGPPGTGKTFQACRVARALLGALPRVRLLWTAWSNTAVTRLVQSALEAGIPRDSMVLVVETVPKDLGVIKALLLTGENYTEWQKLLAKKRQLNVFVTVGKTQAVPTGYKSVIELWQYYRFDLGLLDEAGQILNYNSLHLPLYIKQLAEFGDPCQLTAYSLLQKEHTTMMRSTTSRIAPVLLRHQYRQDQGLGTWNSCLSYSGLVEDAEVVPRAKSVQLLFVLWNHPVGSAEEAKSPAAAEAQLVCEIWRSLELTSKGNKAKIITPYSLQKRLIARILNDSSAVSTTDSIQGHEVDTVVFGAGRNHGVGFLDDPRRNNVAQTRAKHLNIMVMCAAIGSHTKTPGHKYWHYQRYTAKKLGVLWNIGAITDPVAQGRSIAEYVRSAGGFTRDDVRSAFADSQAFYTSYMQNIAGSLVEAGPIEESDNEATEPHDAIELGLEADGHETAGDEGCPLEAELELGRNLEDAPVIPTAVLNALVQQARSPEVFCGTFVVTMFFGVGKLVKAACFRDKTMFEEVTRDGNAAFRTHQQIKLRDMCLETLAWLLHLRLRRTYGAYAIDSKFLTRPFQYPAGITFNLEKLVSDQSLCVDYLNLLWNASGSSDGSSLFYQYPGFDVSKSPWQYVDKANYQVILPYAIAAALMASAFKVVKVDPCGKDTNAVGKKPGKALTYHVDIPVWCGMRWSTLNAGLAEDAIRESGRGKSKRELEPNSNCLRLKPCNLSSEFRFPVQEVNQSLTNLCMDFDSLYSTAVEKERWWYRDLSQLLRTSN